MLLDKLKIVNHPILGNLELDFTNEEGIPYKNVIFVGENGCGKTSILKQIENYNSSEYIKDKSADHCNSIFLSQELKIDCLLNMVMKGISGEALKFEDTLLKDNIINDPNRLISSANEFNNTRLIVFIKHKISELLSSTNEKVGISNSRGTGESIDNFSSGEQELGLKLLYLKNKITYATDAILVDEIETALHPRWQLEIYNFLKSIICENSTGGRDAQLFIATHSENILKSVIKDPEALIIRLFKEDKLIKYQKISSMDLILDEATFPEVQYLIFGIPTIEYHICLYGKLQAKWGTNVKETDNKICEHQKIKSEKIHTTYTYKNGYTEDYYTLPTYIRNKIDHPDNLENDFTDEQLQESIELLRNIIKAEKN